MVAESGISRGRAIIKRGKLIKIDASFRDDRIEELKITGDFFLHPEEKIDELEKSLRGKSVKEIREVIERVLENAEYVGLSPDTLVEAVNQAWKRRN